MKSLFEQMGGTYRQEGDYLIPNLVSPDTESYSIGKYGQLHRSFLKEHHRILYDQMLLNGTIWKYLEETDRSCNEQMETIISKMAKQENVTESLKAVDQMEWVRRMNSIRSRAEEIVLAELVYA